MKFDRASKPPFWHGLLLVWETVRAGWRWISRHPMLATFVLSAIATIFLAVIPDYYTLQARIPPVEQLKRSEGVLELKHTTKWGDFTHLHTPAGRLSFTCAMPRMRDVTCIKPKDGRGKPYSGRRAVIWWFEMPDYPGSTVPYAMQVEVEGKAVLGYTESLERIKRIQTDPWASTKIQTVVFGVIFSVIFLWNNRKGSKAK